MEEQENSIEKEEISLRPPYASSGQADGAIDIFRRIAPKKIDKKFVVDNNLATTTNSFRIIDLYRWFGIIDNEGNIIPEVTNKLRLIGDEKSKFMVDSIKKAYRLLFDTISVENAKKEDVINFFVSNYNFSQLQAKFATTLFLYFCQKYNIPVSEELKINIGNYQKNTEGGKKRDALKEKVANNSPKTGKVTTLPSHKELGENMVVISINGVINKEFAIKNKEELKKIKETEMPNIFQALEFLVPDKKQERIDE